MPSILLIHGAWVTPRCWDGFRARFEARGARCHTPAWPHLDGDPATLRAAPPPDLARVGVGELVEHYAAHIARLPEPPVIVGHSFGGLVTQLLLDRGLGKAGVAIDPAPVRGVMPAPWAFRSTLPIVTAWRGWRRVLPMTPRHWHRTFANGLDADAAARAWQDQYVPAPGRPFFQVALSPFSRLLAVAHERPRPPLLLVAGDQDRTIPASMVRATHRRYRKCPTPVELRELPGRSHYLIAEPGWEEVADLAWGWAERHG